MSTRAAAQKPDGSRREVVRRVRVWKRVLLRVSDTTSTLTSYQWVQTSEIAMSAAERAAKRPKLTPFKDQNVKPIPSRARSERTVQEISAMQNSQEPPQLVNDSSVPSTRAGRALSAAADTSGTEAGKENPTGSRGTASGVAASVPSRPASITPHSTPVATSKQPEASGWGGPAAAAPCISNSPAAAASKPISAANFSFGGASEPTAAKPQDDSQPGTSAATAASPSKFNFGAVAPSGAAAVAKFTFGQKPTVPVEPKKFNFGSSK